MIFETLARQSYKAFEPFTAMVYFVPEVAERMKAVGLNRRQAYFCGRAAAMGVVPGQVVAALFYNFNPTLASSALDSGWKITTPASLIPERFTGIGEALQRLLAPQEGEPELLGQLERGLELTRTATEGLSVYGRGLFAAHQTQPWPEAPLVALWHGVNLLREFRGDGHVAALLVEEINPIESLLMQTAFNPLVPLPALLQSRAWSEAEVEAARQSLNQRGFIENEKLTESGLAVRERVEQSTDRLDRQPFQNLGEAGSQELLTIIGSFSRRINKRGALGFGTPTPAAKS